MSARPRSVSAWTVRGLYFLSVLLVFWPLTDLVTNTWPIQIANFRWRYGFAGLLGGFHLTPLFGYVLMLLTAIWQEDSRMLRTLAVAGFVSASLLTLVMVAFPLDVLQVAATRESGILPALMAGAVLAEAKHLTTLLVLLMLSFGSWSTADKVGKPAGGGPKEAAGIVRRTS